VARRDRAPADDTGATAARHDGAAARPEALGAQEDDPDALVVRDDDPDTLLDERRAADHPEQFGRPGLPLRRNSPFYVGFVGATGVFGAWFLVQSVVQARAVLVLIVVSMFLAIGLNPTVEWLMSRGMRRALAVGVVFLLFLLALLGFIVSVVPPVVEQTRTFVESAPELIDRLQESRTVARLDDNFGILDRIQDYVASGALGERFFGGILGVGKIVLGAVFSVFTVLVLTLYFLASLPSIKRQAYRFAPASRRERVTLLGDEILLRIGGYVSGAFLVATVAGVSSYVFLLILGVPYALALSIFVGLMALVPMVGATIGALAAATVAFFNSWYAGVLALVFYGIYQQVENYVVYPRVMRRAVDVPAALTVMAVLVGGTLLGVVGALLAIPTAAATLLLAREVLIPRQDRL
ncbi:MAG: AI-2E family transporter, partial [Actinomycetota bacterium]|nr:AI-2E family transporter [Actinomycetota bacterium]